MEIASFVVIVALIMASGIPASAHHSFAGTYILDNTVTIEGTISLFDIRNPHSSISMSKIPMARFPNGVSSGAV